MFCCKVCIELLTFLLCDGVEMCCSSYINLIRELKGNPFLKSDCCNPNAADVSSHFCLFVLKY